VAFGIGLSIPIVIWGSGLLARLMSRYAWIVWLGGGVLGWVAGEMVVKDKIVHGWIEPWVGVLHWVAPSALAVILTLLGWWLDRRARNDAPEGAETPATE
jgi:predicted tellurium resistance membrane protein TerC